MKKLIITLILVISLVGCKSKINLPKVDTNLPLNLILPEREYEDQGELIKERQVIESITINELTLEDSEYYKKMYSELRNLNLRDNFKLLTLDFGEVINFNWQPELIEKFNITKYEDWNTIVKNISVYDENEESIIVDFHYTKYDSEGYDESKPYKRYKYLQYSYLIPNETAEKNLKLKLITFENGIEKDILINVEK